jgi:hypothetical protein
VLAVLPNRYQALCIHESNKCLHFAVVSIACNGKVGVPGGGGGGGGGVFLDLCRRENGKGKRQFEWWKH